jgi:two-component system response regulator MprA
MDALFVHAVRLETSFVEKAGRHVEHILVIDDDPGIRTFVAFALETEGYGVETANDGIEALERIDRCVPSAMLLDIRMPRMDGPGLVQHLRERGQWIPTVVMTADSKPQQRCRDLGADACLGKPFTLDQLIEAVQQVWRAN